jgi:hypothetical protein
MANLWGGQSQVGTQTNTNAPWTPQQPFLYDMFGRANDQVSAGGQPNRFQNSAINSMQGMQGQHNPYSGMNNPYLQGSIDSASQDAMRNLQPMLNQANAQSGSFGNTGVAETYGRAAANTLGNISNNARMGAYNQDAQTWGQDQTRNMSGATDMYNMGTNYGNIPWNNINNYHNAITGTYGGTQSSPIMGGGTQDTLGTLSTVAGLWNAYNNYNKNSG